MRFVLHGAAVVALTLLSQLGGLAWAAALLAKRRRIVVFLLNYAALWLLAAMIAPQFGRVALPCLKRDDAALAMQSPLYCALNRHYVAPEMRALALDLAAHMERRFPGTLTLALDANFPFVDGFPLLPHLSHDDGRKLDLAFYYRASKGDYMRGATKSPIGYWGFEPPPGRSACEGKSGLLRWDMGWFQPFNRDYRLGEARSAAMLRFLAQDARTGKILIEPHLETRLGVQSGKIRFQGCRAARHDDHIHVQLAPPIPK